MWLKFCCIGDGRRSTRERRRDAQMVEEPPTPWDAEGSADCNGSRIVDRTGDDLVKHSKPHALLLVERYREMLFGSIA